MASSTRYYGIGFFDFGDPLGTDFAGQIEVDRFTFIDKQIYGLMSVFGNGVISGWEVTAEDDFAVSISAGYGNINFVAARTEFPDSVVDIPINTISYLYAKKAERTRFAEDIDFVISTVGNITDPNFLLLAKITTDNVSITEIDNEVRQEIGFIELIKAAIKLHKHRGGSNYPSKIDLESEVQGQLPSFRIADFDAEKVTTGTFDLARMPYLDHQDLQNVGLLTHPQLDSFVKTLESSNKEIFGEIGLANLLQLVIAMKLVHDDPDSALYIANRWVDQYMINEFVVIPGITPDSFIDFDNSTATINLDQHYIAGIPPVVGTSFYINYDTALAWNSAYSLENMIVSGNSVTLSFNQDDETSIITIEGFESSTQAGQSLTGDNGQTLFTKQTVIVTDEADIVANDSSTNVVEGFWSGKFSSQQSFRNQYIKEFVVSQDWSTYDSFVLYVKCLDIVHGPVKLYFENSDGKQQSIHYTVLEESTVANPKITSNVDPTANDFEQRLIDLGNIPFRDDIKKFVIYTDDLENPFHFYIDYINIQRAILLPEQGTVILRYSTSAKVIFSTIDWSSIEPSGTSIRVRARSADGTAWLTRAEYTPSLTNGALINLEGTDIEIEIKFFPDAARVNAPVLTWLRILILTEADLDGFTIDDNTAFNRGTTANATVTSGHIELETPIYVDSYYFALANLINQVYENTSSAIAFTEADDVALFGTSAPIAPNTIFEAVESNRIGSVTTSRFFEPRCVRRQNARTFVVADTYNDRIMEYEEDGTLVAGIGSINYEHSDKIFPISCCFDVRTGILYIVWSKRISFKTVDVGQITLQTTTQQINLTRNFDKIQGLTMDELDQVNAEGQIMPVYLSTQNAGAVELFPTDNTAYMFASTNTLSSGMNIDSEFYKRASTALGIPMFVGNFMYMDGIFSPTWADKTDDDHYIVANGKIAVKEWDFPAENFSSGQAETISLNGSNGVASVSSIIEIDTNNQIVWGSDILNFSPFVPGRAEKISDHTLLIGGLRPGGTIGTDLSQGKTFDFRSLSGTADIRREQKSVLNEMFFTKAGTPFEGAVLVYDTLSNATSFEYRSAEGVVVSDVDIDPISSTYVVAECSFERSGRIIKLDSTGNVVYSFGEGTYGVINSVRIKSSGEMVIST